MEKFSTSAILLRRIEYGDADLIITFLTPEKGKISVIAKSAKKSVKRFGGLLELFSALRVVCGMGRGKLPILQEAALEEPFEKIRGDIKKTACASYWAELLNEWLEEKQEQKSLYMLLRYALGELNTGADEEFLNILFQMKFMSVSGFCPNLTCCCGCGLDTDLMGNRRIFFDLKRGGLLCEKCAPGTYQAGIRLSNGTVKQLRWIETRPPDKAGRIRFSPNSLTECRNFLEAFVPFHIGKKMKSLSFLRQIRG